MVGIEKEKYWALEAVFLYMKNFFEIVDVRVEEKRETHTSPKLVTIIIEGLAW